MTTIICTRTGSTVHTAAGTVTRSCGRCGHDVAVSPSIHELMASREGQYELMCQVCVATARPYEMNRLRM